MSESRTLSGGVIFLASDRLDERDLGGAFDLRVVATYGNQFGPIRGFVKTGGVSIRAAGRRR